MANELFGIFAPYPWLVAALSQRSDGTMTTAGVKTREPAVVSNFTAYFQQLGLKPENAVRCKQVHGKKVAAVDAKNRGKSVRDTDGLVTSTQNVLLTVTVADCLPIFFLDPRRRVVGLAHAGWRSLQRGVIAAEIALLSEKFGCRCENLRVGIGPGIAVCHFAVGPDVEEKFREFPSALQRQGEGAHLDLKRVAGLQLQQLGVRREHIEVHPDCTACLPEKYFSYRRDKPAVVDAMVAVIGIRS